MPDEAVLPLIVAGVAALLIVVSLLIYDSNQKSKKEAAARQAAELLEMKALLDKAEEAAQILAQGDTKPIEIKGDTGTYTVDMLAQTCTCPDFQTFRDSFPAGSLRRFCKHLAEAMSFVAEPWSLQAIILKRVHFGLAPTDHYCVTTLDDGRQFFMFRHADREWCDVIAPKVSGKKCELYGLNVVTGQWSYGIAPGRAKEIKAKVSAWAQALALASNSRGN